MKQIEILGMKYFAHHGWYEIEQKIGQYFTVDLSCKILSNENINDELNKTIDYQELYNRIKNQMEKPCKLIETLLDNIGNDLLGNFPTIHSISLKIYKQPSLGGIIDSISISATYNAIHK